MSKLALVTGTGGVLGSAIARSLAEDGWSVALHGLPGEPLDKLEEELSFLAPTARFRPFVCDLLQDEAPSTLLHDVEEWGGRIDGLVNNAALPSRSLLSALGAEEWGRVMRLNVLVPTQLIAGFAAMRRSTIAAPTGVIVNVSSRTYSTGGPVAYVTSKAALVGLTHAAAWELGPQGIRVNAVAPSTMITPFTASDRSPDQVATMREQQSEATLLHRLVEPWEVAQGVTYLMSDRSSFVTGEVLHIAGGGQLPPMPKS